jgi:hypothetical protein
MADAVYNRAKANIDISDLRVLLLVGSTFDADDDNITQVIAGATKECDFTNYARKALGSESHTIDDSANTAVLDANDPSTWSSAGGASNNTISAMVVYQHVGASDDDNLPVSYHDTGFPITTNGGDLTVAFAAAGIIVTS